MIGNVAVLDTSRRSWQTAPERLIHTSQHRVVLPEASIGIGSAQRVHGTVHEAVTSAWAST